MTENARSRTDVDLADVAVATVTGHEDSASDEGICGETFDHLIEYVADDEDAEQWVCRRCGAEGWNDYSDSETS